MNVSGQSLSKRLLVEDIEYAFTQGVSIVEGYLVELDKSYRFMGALGISEAIGFVEASTASNGRKMCSALKRMVLGN